MNTGISNIRKHRTPVIQLLFQIGFGKKEIIKSTDFSIAQINYDLRSFDTTELHHDRPIGRLQKNMSILKSFASLDTKHERELSDVEKEVLIILKKKVFYGKMKGMTEGMQYTLDYMESFELHNDFVRDHAPYAKLKRELSVNNSKSIRNTAGRARPLFKEFLRLIAKDDTRTKLDSLEITPDHPIYDFFDSIINQKKNDAINHWSGEKFIQQIDSAVEKLPQRQREVIRQYFGFGVRPKTLEEIGKSFKPEITRQAAQQHKEAALSSMREELLIQSQGQ